MVLMRNMDARLEVLEKAMEEQANRLTAIEARLDEQAAIQKSQFDGLRQQLAALGYLLGHNELLSIPAAVETTTTITVPPPVDTLPAIATTTEVLSSPSSLTLPLIATRTAHLVPDSPTVPPPHLPLLLQQPSPLLSQQQPTISIPVSAASQLPPPSMVSDSMCMYLVTPLPHIMILLKELQLQLLCLAGRDLPVHRSVGWLKSFGKQIDVETWKVWAVF